VLLDFLAGEGGGEGISATLLLKLGPGDGGALGRLLSEGKLYLIFPDAGSWEIQSSDWGVGVNAEDVRMGDLVVVAGVVFFLFNEGKLYRGKPVLGSLVIHSEGGTDVDLEGGDWGGVVISSSEVEVFDASHSAEVLETQGDISDISGIVSKEVTIGMDWVLLVIVIMLCGLVVMVIE
jgi:hypothetical protein